MIRVLMVALVLALAACDTDQRGCAWVVNSNTGYDGREC